MYSVFTGDFYRFMIQKKFDVFAAIREPKAQQTAGEKAYSLNTDSVGKQYRAFRPWCLLSIIETVSNQKQDF